MNPLIQIEIFKEGFYSVSTFDVGKLCEHLLAVVLMCAQGGLVGNSLVERDVLWLLVVVISRLMYISVSD